MDVYSLDQTNEQQGKKSNWIIIALVAGGFLLVVCLCCIVLGAVYFIPNSEYFLPASTPTPAPTPFPTKTTIPTKMPLISEQFISNTNGWAENVISDDYGVITYTINGQYLWDVTAAKSVIYKTWPEYKLMASDFVLTVDAQRQNGPEVSSYGVVFRLADNSNFYYFGISDVGQYYVAKLLNDQWISLIEWTDTSSIYPGQVNSLKVVAIGNQFTFFINGDQVNTANDDAFPSGYGGLAIELYYADDSATFVFDNFVMDTP